VLPQFPKPFATKLPNWSAFHLDDHLCLPYVLSLWFSDLVNFAFAPFSNVILYLMVRLSMKLRRWQVKAV